LVVHVLIPTGIVKVALFLNALDIVIWKYSGHVSFKLFKRWQQRCKDQCGQRDALNEKAFTKYSNGREIFKFGNLKLFKGCRLMCIDNKWKSKGFINSKRFVVSGLKGDTLKLKTFDDSKECELQPNMMSSFVYGYAFTIYKIQGCKIDEDYNIVIGRMSANELYTALSRGTKASNVNYKYTDRLFHWDTPNNKLKSLQLKSEELLDTAYIYQITFDNDTIYIGSTAKQLEERLAEHKEQPVSKDMREMMFKHTYTIEAVYKYTKIGRAELERREYEEINEAIQNGCDLLNIRGVKKEKIKTLATIKEKNIDKEGGAKLLEYDKEFRVVYYENGKAKQIKIRKTGNDAADREYAEKKLGSVSK